MPSDVASLLTQLPTLHHFTWVSFVVIAVLSFFVLILLLQLRPKYFYIVRHGRTVLNEAHIKQGAEGALNSDGRSQARAIGHALSTLKIQAIYSSTYERALETASLINAELQVRIHTTPLLAERRSPSEVRGKPTKDPEVERIVAQTEKSFHNDTYRFSDEENFTDLKKRAALCLSFLEKTSCLRVCAVTHHAFLQMFLSYLLYRDTLTASTYATLAFFNPAENGGITVCKYEPAHRWFSPTRGWSIVSYNQLVSSECVTPEYEASQPVP